MEDRRGSDSVDQTAPGVAIESAAEASPHPPFRSPRSLLRTIALGVLGLVAAVAFLYSGLLLLLGTALSPNAGNEAILLVEKVVDIVGWFAIGGWLLLDWLRSRARVIAAPVAAWLWTYVFAGLMSAIGFLNIGY